MSHNVPHMLIMMHCIMHTNVLHKTLNVIRSECELLVPDHLFLQLAELRGHGLQAYSCLLELLVCCSNQVAAPVRRLTSIFQLMERNKVENE